MHIHRAYGLVLLLCAKIIINIIIFINLGWFYTKGIAQNVGQSIIEK